MKRARFLVAPLMVLAGLFIPISAGATAPITRHVHYFARPFALPGTHPSGYSPAGLQAIYGWKKSGGAGKTVAIVDAAGSATVKTDLKVFSQTFGLPYKTTTLTVFYPEGQAPATLGWGLETTLDVEWVHAVAPQAHIDLVVSNNATYTSMFAAVAFASKQAQYVSMSWGGPTTPTELPYTVAFSSKVSYFAATGDTAGVLSYPATSPHTTAVGGTTVTTANGVWQQTVGWSTGGGGCSLWEKPSIAQASDTAERRICPVNRGTPDFSLDADPATGVAIYDSSWPKAGTLTVPGPWVQIGGTSLSTVLAAGHAANLGFAVNQTVIYGGHLKISPVTSGGNGYTCRAYYNFCAGLGAWNTAHGVASRPPTTKPKPPLKVKDIVGLTSTPTGTGYWLVGKNGDVFAFGSARYYGSLKGTVDDIAGLTSTPTGQGYWLVASNGTVYAYGTARNYGG